MPCPPPRSDPEGLRFPPGRAAAEARLRCLPCTWRYCRTYWRTGLVERTCWHADWVRSGEKPRLRACHERVRSARQCVPRSGDVATTARHQARSRPAPPRTAHKRTMRLFTLLLGVGISPATFAGVAEQYEVIGAGHCGHSPKLPVAVKSECESRCSADDNCAFYSHHEEVGICNNYPAGSCTGSLESQGGGMT
eukprot:scaffold18939_cov69-Phaeocystis_antarctica.AAC.5